MDPKKISKGIKEELLNTLPNGYLGGEGREQKALIEGGGTYLIYWLVAIGRVLRYSLTVDDGPNPYDELHAAAHEALTTCEDMGLMREQIGMMKHSLQIADIALVVLTGQEQYVFEHEERDRCWRDGKPLDPETLVFEPTSRHKAAWDLLEARDEIERIDYAVTVLRATGKSDIDMHEHTYKEIEELDRDCCGERIILADIKIALREQVNEEICNRLNLITRKPAEDQWWLHLAAKLK